MGELSTIGRNMMSELKYHVFKQSPGDTHISYNDGNVSSDYFTVFLSAKESPVLNIQEAVMSRPKLNGFLNGLRPHLTPQQMVAVLKDLMDYCERSPKDMAPLRGNVIAYAQELKNSNAQYANLLKNFGD